MCVRSFNAASFFICFVFIALFPGALSAEEVDAEYWSSDFFGISWELSGSFGSTRIAIDTAQVDALSLVATYGNANVFQAVPVRLRAGLGWWKGRPFMATAGMEIALLEILSPAHSRMIGFYTFGDVHMRLFSTGIRFSFEPSARLLIPLHGLGGIAIGVGYDTDLGITWHIENMNGIYPIK